MSILLIIILTIIAILGIEKSVKFAAILTLASLTSFLIFIIFTLMSFALIQVKRKDPNPKGIISYSVWIPIVVIAVNLILLSIQIFSVV